MTKILIVDDEEFIRALLRSTLEPDGYTVEEDANDRKALALYQEQPADLVITDIAMPEMNGLCLLTELTAKYANIKIIAMSGLDSNLAVATLLGACETVLKPFNLDELVRMANNHTGTLAN